MWNPVQPTLTAGRAIYLGERFRACVSLTHKYSYPLNDVGVKIEMQTDVKRTTLLDSSGDRFTFGVDEVKDYILSHTVEEIGEHRCVSYTVISMLTLASVWSV